MNTVTLQGNPTFHHKNRKGNRRSGQFSRSSSHCQQILTREDSLNSLHLQALHWASDGDLIAADRFTLLNTLVQQSIPEVQLELIRCMECMASEEASMTTQVSNS